jgi:hypothetical protein
VKSDVKDFINRRPIGHRAVAARRELRRLAGKIRNAATPHHLRAGDGLDVALLRMWRQFPGVPVQCGNAPGAAVAGE